MLSIRPFVAEITFRRSYEVFLFFVLSFYPRECLGERLKRFRKKAVFRKEIPTEKLCSSYDVVYFYKKKKQKRNRERKKGNMVLAKDAHLPITLIYLIK